MEWGNVRINQSNFPFLYFFVFTVVHKTILIFHLSSMSISGGFYMVDCSPCLIMRRCRIVMLVYLSLCFFITPYMMHGQFLSKPSLIAFGRLVVVRMKSFPWIYCASSGLVVFTRMLFSTISNFCLQGNLPHLCLLVPGAL